MITCRTLLGHRKLDFSINCLKSCVRMSIDPVVIEIFEDGSLTEDDVKFISLELPDSKIFFKKDRDVVMKKLLAQHPHCLKMRKLNVFGSKLFDIMVYQPKNFYYLDTDIIFYRRFKFPAFMGYPIFMKDAGNGYCFSDLMILKTHKYLIPQLNAGFSHYPPELFSLDFIENILIKYYTPTTMHHSWAEQTMWSFLASSQEEVHYFHEKHVVMPYSDIPITPELVAIHFVSVFRNRIPQVKAYIDKNPLPKEDITISTKRIEQHLSIISYFYLKYRSKFARKLLGKNV